MPAHPDLLDDYQEKRVQAGDLRLAYFERGAERRGQKPTLLFAHATGFHARLWDRIVRAFPGHHVVALDQRGHGRSDKRQVQHWREVVQDLTQFIIALDLNNLVGIGHSMGGHALVGAAGQEEARFKKLILLDPVIFKEADYDLRPPSGAMPESHPTAKRRREFSSPEEMVARLSSKGSYGLFEPDVMLDYCRYGLLPNPEGDGYVLACPPEIEASLYLGSLSNKDIYQAVRRLQLPVLVVRAMEAEPLRDTMDFSKSPTWPGLAKAFRNGRDIYYADKTHFLPMQIPDEIAKLIQDELDGLAAAPS